MSKRYLFLLPAALTVMLLVSCASMGSSSSEPAAGVPAAGASDVTTTDEESEKEAAEVKTAATDSDDASSSSPPSVGKKAEEDAAPAATAEREGLRGSSSETGGESEFVTEMSERDTSAKIAPEIAATGDSRTTTARGAPSASGLKAGFADDNKQFNYFIHFLQQYRNVNHYDLGSPERIMLKVQDTDGNSVPNAEVEIFAGSRIVTSGKTFADGSFLFFPGGSGDEQTVYRAVVSFLQTKAEQSFTRDGSRSISMTFPLSRPEYRNVPLDILFVLDTTGSMGEEIERLKTTIDIINMNLVSLSSEPKVRFGMVLYKDRGDEEYITRVIPLTDDVEAFSEELDQVYASGGGDTPEDLQAALKDAVTAVQWDPNGIRLGFIITDAPPQFYSEQKTFTYADAAREAKKKAIKFFSVGTGGLEISGEYILRQISQYTYAKYIFLTYGEAGESEGGRPGSVSHHTGANYETGKLEAIIIRFAKEELSHLTEQPLEDDEGYFQATKISEETREETLLKLFESSLSQLVDFSTYRIEKDTPAGLLPILPAENSLALSAEYFYDRLIQSLSTSDSFKAVERRDMQKIMEELELALSDLAENAPQVGKLLGAELLISGSLYKRQNVFELFLRLLRVETGEILAVSRARIDLSLGL